ncbi:MAG: 1-deoxy-D-xylulose 5-phosphate reductoisomerase [Chlamydiales bacterium]|nr:1-deoxy-D-xylulose 5-phosphate reductoisomerase [Chlamydiales bacterium]MCH9620032.1 1-deoxy-D-xylulose 5-phosphate reductoisomerase [Chlamydiales bacterium]MCH9622865.1 1-deoxy-D-xylulose 5-phosphate reductoisomerase [Chlamydiales bacterium]
MKIALLGSTGSIGKTTLRVADHLGYEVVALAAHSNDTLLGEQITRFKPKIVALYDSAAAARVRNRFPSLQVLEGEEGMEEIASFEEASYVIMAIVGMAALRPTLAAILAGKTIGLANKEVLVSAGELVTTLAKEKNVPLIPIDSEHSAIFQCLQKMEKSAVRRIILTASGGPFRNYSEKQLASITKKEALSHPTWNMGPKVTIDSSTLMNKGLEMIEAYWLFKHLPEVVVHPQSLVHSFVEAIDGSIFAQISEPDMSFPIQYALTYPKRAPGLFPPFDFTKNSRFEFYSPDVEKFPALTFAKEALKLGKSLPCYLNAANEILVAKFLQEKIGWLEIGRKLEYLLESHQPIEVKTLENVLAVDAMAREEAERV